MVDDFDIAGKVLLGGTGKLGSEKFNVHSDRSSNPNDGVKRDTPLGGETSTVE